MIGRADEKWGEVPVAIVSSALGAVPQADLALADLEKFLSERLARYKHPKALEIVDALPRNPAGKVLKTELRELSARQSRLTLAKVPLRQRFLLGTRHLTRGGEFANGYVLNPADAVHRGDCIGYSPVVRLPTGE